MYVRYNLRVSNVGFPNPGGRTLALRTKLFKPTEHAYSCLVHAKEHDTWLDLNTKPEVFASSADEVWWLAKSSRSEMQTQ